jgi:hypothetical protein
MLIAVAAGSLITTEGAGLAGSLAATVIAGHIATGGILLVFSTFLGIQVRRYVLPTLAPLADMQATW